MAGSVNKVMLIGNVGKDPEARTFQNGGKSVSFFAGDVRKLERQKHRRTSRTHAMAQHRHLK